MRQNGCCRVTEVYKIIQQQGRFAVLVFLEKFGVVGMFKFCRIKYLHLMRARVSGGHLCVAEAPTEAVAETVDFAKQKTEGEIAQAFTTPQSHFVRQLP